MKPIGPLMREHKLIEKMPGFFEGETKKINAQKKMDPKKKFSGSS